MRDTLVPMTVPALILAAGASRRLGQPKQLIKYCGETLLERALRVAKEAGATPVVVLLGAHFKRIRAMIPFNDAIPVLNDKWEKGLSSSIHAGLHELDIRAPDAPGALLMSCDQPRLTAIHLHALLTSFAAQPTPSIVASSYSGAQGVPAVFPGRSFPICTHFAATKVRVR